jgi:hypothetical protein
MAALAEGDTIDELIARADAVLLSKRRGTRHTTGAG